MTTVKHLGLSLAVLTVPLAGPTLAQAQSAPPPAEAPGGSGSQAPASPAPFGIAGDGPSDSFALQLQATATEQFHPAFGSPYRGPQSLDPGARGDETVDLTAFIGFRLWRGAELWMDPEIDQGFGLSDTLGVDAFTSAEAYKVGDSSPYPRIQRLFMRQTVNLGGDGKPADGDINQFAASQTADRLVFTFGKVSVPDIFDTNAYAHDPKNDFLNWAAVDAGSFDYAADAWGFTYGAAVETYLGPWTFRGGVFDLSGVPNSKSLDKSFHQYQLDGEIERRFTVFGRGGAIRVTGFLSRGRMGRYEDAVTLAEETGAPADVALVRHYHSRPGLSFNLEQALADDLGLFARAGHADGAYEGYEFTDISTSVEAGLALKGDRWGRKDDALGLVLLGDEASKGALAYFAAGGLGILAGDGRLPHPGTERIVETYYSLPLLTVTHVTVDYQFVDNPAFNRDRGPVSVISLRLHAQI